MSVKIEFDDKRDVTLKEMILIQRIQKADWEALIELVLLRAKDPKPSREDLEALPLTEVGQLTTDLALVLKKAQEQANKIIKDGLH